MGWEHMVIYIIDRPAIIKFILIDVLIGYGIYFGTLSIYPNLLVSSISSIIGTQGVKHLISKPNSYKV